MSDCMLKQTYRICSECGHRNLPIPEIRSVDYDSQWRWELGRYLAEAGGVFG